LYFITLMQKQYQQPNVKTFVYAQVFAATKQHPIPVLNPSASITHPLAGPGHACGQPNGGGVAVNNVGWKLRAKSRRMDLGLGTLMRAWHSEVL
jgi:hypothetical protein